jgi:hypothetical protein
LLTAQEDQSKDIPDIPDDDDGSGNNNQLVPLFRKWFKKYAIGVSLFALVLVIVLIVEATLKWNVRPSWIKKVPCVIQPQIKPVEDVLKNIERYFLVTDMIPPFATAIFAVVHLATSRKKTDREYTPPSLVPMVLIWSFKIFAPLMVYMFINVKDDVFVKYDGLSQKLCEATVSLSLYPPGTTSGMTKGIYEEMKNAFSERANLTASEEQQLSKLGSLVADAGNFFSVSNVFSDLRNVVRLYFMNKKNRFYSSENFGGDTDWDFESALADISVNVLTESERRHGHRRSGDDEWWKEFSIWKKPEEKTCRRDVKPKLSTAQKKQSTDKKEFQFAGIKDSGDGCMVGEDPDNHVYESMKEFVEPQEFAVKFCQTGMRLAKKRFGYNSGEASAWTIKQLLDHIVNIITGQSFSYTFCDAETALLDKFFYGNGVRDAGMSAYVKSANDADYYMKCEWIRNDNNFLSEKVIGKGISSKEECLIKVNTDIRCTSMTVANYRSGGGVCKCQKGSDMREDTQSPAVSCWLSTILTKDEAKRAASLQISDICTEFARKPQDISSLIPGVLRWLDPQVLRKESKRAPVEFIEKLNLNVDFASNTTNVDLCDTHMHNSSVVSMFCLLMGIKDPKTGVNALSAQMCPQIIQDLDLADAACQNIPDEPVLKSAAGTRGRKVTKKARCQIEFANGKNGERLADRVRNNTASQLVKYTSFMKLLPQNYTSLSILVERMAQGLFSTEKESSRVGAPAEPRDFNEKNNPLPPKTSLQHSAGRCLGGTSQSIGLEYILSPDETDILGTRVKIPDEFLKNTGIDGLPDKATLNFTGMSHKFCWDTCRKFYKDTIAIDGPSVRPPKQKPCTFPFTDGKKQYWSCIPDDVIEANKYVKTRRRNAPNDDTEGYGYGEGTGAGGYDSVGGNDAGDSGIGGDGTDDGTVPDAGTAPDDGPGFTMVPFVEVDTNNDTCISKEEFDNSTYNSLIFFQVVEPGPIEDQEEFAKQLFSTFAKVYNPPGAPPGGDCGEDKVSEAEFNAIAYYFTGTPVDYGGGYGYGGGAEGGDGTAGGQGEDLSNYVECTITFAVPLSDTQQFDVKKSYAKQAGVPVVNVVITAVNRRDTTYKVSVRAKDASDLAKVRTQLADSRTLIKAIEATVLIFPPRLASPAQAGSLPYAALYAQTHLTPLPFYRACLCGRA